MAAGYLPAFRTCTRDEWLAGMGALGLALRDGPAAVSLAADGAVFHRMLAALSPVASSGPRETFWATGSWDGTRVLVALLRELRKDMTVVDRTVVLAEVWPLRFDDPHFVATVPVAGRLPAAVYARVREPAAFHAVIGEGSPLSGTEVALRASFVAFSYSGAIALPRPEALTLAVRLAQMLAHPPPEKPFEFEPALRETSAPSFRFLELENAWSAFATARELAFDAQQWQMRGFYAGSEVRMDLHVEQESYVVDVAARLRVEAGASIEVGREASRSWIARTLRPDVRTGDAAFDGAFWIRGEPDEAAIRALLALTELRAAISRTMEWAATVSVHRSSVVAHSALAPQTDPAIARAFDDVVALAELLSPVAAQAAPYR
jgi:hypothetical protein